MKDALPVSTNLTGAAIIASHFKKDVPEENPCWIAGPFLPFAHD
jgi:hypothetical protein